ncbi:MAG: lysylphosphatidylglycerol synthase domain-containing protein [Myxococcota bacterium]
MRPSLRVVASTAIVLVGLPVGAVVLIAQVVPDFYASQHYGLDGPMLGLAGGLLAAVWGLDAARYRHVGRALGVEVGWGDGLRMMMLFHLGAWLTPASLGATSGVAWYLHRRGACLATAIAIASVGPVFTMVVTGLGAAVAIGLTSQPPPGLGPAAGLAALVTGLIVATFFGALSRPAAAEALRRARRNATELWVGQLGLALAWYVACLLLMLSLVAAAGVPGPWLERLVDCALFRASAHVAPTPGGAGVAEGGIAWFFGTSHAIMLIVLYRTAFFGLEALGGLAVVGAEWGLGRSRALRGSP